MSNQIVYGSQPINGQLVPELTATQIFPSNAFVPYYQGRASFTPTLPPPIQYGQGTAMDPYTSGLMGGGSSMAAIQDPFNPTKSPVLWAVGFLIIGMLGLRHIHWRG
jgi:hypothetical protein